MRKSRRLMWFAFAVAAILATLGLLWGEERVQSLGMAATAACYGVFEWMFGPNKEDD